MSKKNINNFYTYLDDIVGGLKTQISLCLCENFHQIHSNVELENKDDLLFVEETFDKMEDNIKSYLDLFASIIYCKVASYEDDSCDDSNDDDSGDDDSDDVVEDSK